MSVGARLPDKKRSLPVYVQTPAGFWHLIEGLDMNRRGIIDGGTGHQNGLMPIRGEGDAVEGDGECAVLGQGQAGQQSAAMVEIGAAGIRSIGGGDGQAEQFVAAVTAEG